MKASTWDAEVRRGFDIQGWGPKAIGLGLQVSYNIVRLDPDTLQLPATAVGKPGEVRLEAPQIFMRLPDPSLRHRSRADGDHILREWAQDLAILPPKPVTTACHDDFDRFNRARPQTVLKAMSPLQRSITS
jgi:hypothetical protein